MVQNESIETPARLNEYRSEISSVARTYLFFTPREISRPFRGENFFISTVFFEHF